MIPKPIENSYWVVEAKFLAGEYPRHIDGPDRFAKLEALESVGVPHFVDLTEEGELKSYSHRLQKGEHLRFPIRDVSVPRRNEHTTAILDEIDTRLENNGIVYLHCWGGVGRTGTIVGCWLFRRGCSRSAGRTMERLSQVGMEGFSLNGRATRLHPQLGRMIND